LFKNGRILECLFDGFVVKARAEDAEGRGMFVLAVENCTFKDGLEFVDRKLGDVIGDLLRVLGP